MCALWLSFLLSHKGQLFFLFRENNLFFFLLFFRGGGRAVQTVSDQEGACPVERRGPNRKYFSYQVISCFSTLWNAWKTWIDVPKVLICTWERGVNGKKATVNKLLLRQILTGKHSGSQVAYRDWFISAWSTNVVSSLIPTKPQRTSIKEFIRLWQTICTELCVLAGLSWDSGKCLIHWQTS